MNGTRPDDGDHSEEKRRLNPAIGFGTSFAVGMVIFALGGHWLDVKFGHESLFTLLGIFLGLIYGGWELWKLIALENLGSDQKQHDRDDHEDPRKGK